MEQRIEQLEREIKELKELVNRLINNYLKHDQVDGGHLDIRKNSIFDVPSKGDKEIS